MSGQGTNAQEMLGVLGYGVSADEIRRFQRDHNKLSRGAGVLLVNGELDALTREAIALAHSARHMFIAVRES